MNKLFYYTAALFVALGLWALSIVTLVVQGGVWLSSGRWVAGRIGDVWLSMGLAEPVEWLGEGSVYSWLWTQPLSFVSFAGGLLLLAYSVRGARRTNARRI